MPFDADKLASFLAKKQSSRTGGKGSVRRKVKIVRKNAGQDDKKLKQTLQKLGVRDILGIEEVNMFKSGNEVIHFEAPKVQANIQSHTYVIQGQAMEKKISELLPGILSQLGPENIAALKDMIDPDVLAQAQAASGGGGDDMPELSGNFGDEEDDMPDLV